MKRGTLLNRVYDERSYSYTAYDEYSYVLMRSYKERSDEVN